MRIKWAEGTPERASVELRIRIMRALRLKQSLAWLADTLTPQSQVDDSVYRETYQRLVIESQRDQEQDR